MGNPQIDRRTLAKGVAWSLPVVAVASAAPATASSPQTQTCPLVVSASGAKGNAQGSKTVTFTVTIVNSGDTTQNVVVTGLSGPHHADWSWPAGDTTFVAQPGQNTFTFTATRHDNSDGVCTLTYTACDAAQTVNAAIS